MKKIAKRGISYVLTLAMILTLVPSNAFAYMADDANKPEVIETTDGSVPVNGSDWETMFPYGTFAFKTQSNTVTEGDGEQIIEVYRLGGTNGVATAKIRYVPSTVQTDDDKISSTNAIGGGEISIIKEDTLPIAQYQELGEDPVAKVGDAEITRSEYKDEEYDDVDTLLSLDKEADSYHWQYFDGDKWRRVNSYLNEPYPASSEALDAFDVRCVYTIGEDTFYSISANGEEYVPEIKEPLSQMPDGIDVSCEQTYSDVEFDAENPYESVDFDLTFADGEWVKQIKYTIKDDNKSQPIRNGMFVIYDYEGGSVYDTANTYGLSVIDNDKVGKVKYHWIKQR